MNSCQLSIVDLGTVFNKGALALLFGNSVFETDYGMMTHSFHSQVHVMIHDTNQPLDGRVYSCNKLSSNSNSEVEIIYKLDDFLEFDASKNLRKKIRKCQNAIARENIHYRPVIADDIPTLENIWLQWDTAKKSDPNVFQKTYSGKRYLNAITTAMMNIDDYIFITLCDNDTIYGYTILTKPNACGVVFSIVNIIDSSLRQKNLVQKICIRDYLKTHYPNAKFMNVGSNQFQPSLRDIKLMFNHQTVRYYSTKQTAQSINIEEFMQ